jgi:SprT protein
VFRTKRRAPARPAPPALEHPYRDWLTAWGALWHVPELPAKAQIVFSRRLTAALGRCTPQSGSIRLNPGLLEAPVETLREIVCHEAAHVAAWLLHGRRARPHGREWKDLMRLAGYEPHVRWAEGSVPLGVRPRRARARGRTR